MIKFINDMLNMIIKTDDLIRSFNKSKKSTKIPMVTHLDNDLKEHLLDSRIFSPEEQWRRRLLLNKEQHLRDKKRKQEPIDNIIRIGVFIFLAFILILIIIKK